MKRMVFLSIMLLVLSSLFIFLSYKFDCNDITSQLFQNIAVSTFLTTFVTIITINVVIMKIEDEKQNKYNKVALRVIKKPIERILYQLVSFYIYSTEKNSKTNNIETFFDKDYYEKIAKLKFYYKTNQINLSTNDNMSIIEAFSFYMNNLNISIENMIFKYSIYLDVKNLELLENIINSKLYEYCKNPKEFERFEIGSIESIGNKNSILSYGDANNSLVEYIHLIVELVKAYNNYHKSNKITIPFDYWQIPGGGFIPGQAKIE